MIIKAILSQREYEAYVMQGAEHKIGHPTFHPLFHYEPDLYYLVVKRSSSEIGGISPPETIIVPVYANKFLYMVVEATDDEKQKLINSGYQMIGLT